MGVSNPLSELALLVYPVGAYYWSSDPTDPSQLFGGTWEQVKDRFVLAAGSTYKVGATGGEATHKLTLGEIPSHTHGLYGKIDSSGNHTVPAEAVYGVQWQSGSSPGKAWLNFTQASGGSGAHNNMPPYIVAYCWRRTA